MTNSLRILKRKLGKHKLLTTPEELLLYSYDATPFRQLPIAVVMAETVDDVLEVVRYARSNGVSITARGAGSGLSGGSVPDPGGVVVSLERMNAIEKIDSNNKIAIVQPGVVTAELQHQVNKLGLFYPPDPSSHTISTIGGNVAENAGGLRCFKYGVTGHYVLGLEYVNAVGEVKGTGIFDSTNSVPDLTSLLVGSEGTLGIVTRIALRLIPKQETTVTLSAYFANSKDAFATVEAIVQNGWTPSVMEYIDKRAMVAAAEYVDVSYPADAEALLLFELDGSDQEVRELLPHIQRLLGETASDVSIATDDNERHRLWELRRAISPSLIRLASGKIHEDIAVPRGNLSLMAQSIADISEQYGLGIAVYGHIGDGNLHVVVMYDASDKDSVQTAQTASQDIFRAAISLGGTITGEHGIGLAKKQYLNWQFSEETLNLSKQIKQMLDPDGIFNRGKMFNEVHKQL